ncbi:unnamed protein product [Rhizophagus irregularis]|nr:unnamed protein product [Rhizophagus irregularis]
MYVREKFSQLRKLIKRESDEPSGRTEVLKTRNVIQVEEPIQVKTAEDPVQMEIEEDESDDDDEPETSKKDKGKLKAKETPSIEEIKKWDTGTLITFLQEQDLGLDNKYFDTFHLQEINGKIFLELTKKELQSYVLNKYGIEGSSIGNISQFSPEPYSIDDNDEELEYCIKDIKRKMKELPGD